MEEWEDEQQHRAVRAITITDGIDEMNTFAMSLIYKGFWGHTIQKCWFSLRVLWCSILMMHTKKGTSKPFWRSKWILMRFCGLYLISSFTSKGWVFMQPSFLHAHSVLIASSVSASLPHLLMCDYNFHNHWNHDNSQGLLLWRSLQAYIAKNFNCACLNNVDLEAPYLDLNSPLIMYILSIIHEASVEEGFATGYRHFLFLDFHHVTR